MPERRDLVVSVIVVTHDSARLAPVALSSAVEAARRARVGFELIVVDNASTDDTSAVVRQEFPTARIVENRDNVGFARANNQAFAMARGRYWLLLNPDARLGTDSLGWLADFLEEHPRVAAVAPAIDPPWGGGPESAGMSPGIRAMAGHFLLVNRLLWRDRGGPWRGFQLCRRRHLGPRPVDWVSGAVALLRPEAVRRVGGFDSRFFLYREDVDLGERLRADGWELWIVPRATASHMFAGSQGRVSTRWVDAAHEHYASRARRPLVVVYDMVMALGLTARAWARPRRRSNEDAIRAEVIRKSARRAWARAGGTASEILGVRPAPVDRPSPR